MATSRSLRSRLHLLVLGALLVLGWSLPAAAFPGFFVGKTAAPRKLDSAELVLLEGRGVTAVTVAPAYSGPMEPLALVLAVPSDVVARDVKALSRRALDGLDAMTAPRFHEFFEQDPCTPGAPEQEWQRDLRVKKDSALPGAAASPAPAEGAAASTFELPKETQVEAEPVFADAGYRFSVVKPASPDALRKWLTDHGYQAPASLDPLVAPVLAEGLVFLIAEFDSSRLELLADGGAELAPIRFLTKLPYRQLPVKLGLANASGAQDLLVYVLHPEKRFVAANLKNVPAPTNLELDREAAPGPGGLWERPGEFYAALQDRVLAQQGDAVVTEYVWSTEGCGEPCPASKLSLATLLSLGGDAVEAGVDARAKRPEPEPLTDEQKANEKALGAPQRKALAEARKEAARIRALLERQRYLVTRLHYRYEPAKAPEFLSLAEAATGLAGGTALPEGEARRVSTAVTEGTENRYQARYNFFRPWGSQVKCDAPEPFRWGKHPRHLRVSNKVWSATQLAKRDRKEISLAKAVRTAVPELGLQGLAAAPATAPKASQVPAAAAAAGAANVSAAAAAEKSSSSCACRTASGSAGGVEHGVLAAALGLLAAGARRRRR